MKLFYIFVTFMFGCAGPVSIDSQDLNFLCTEKSLSPDESLLKEVALSAARWEHAHGCSINVGKSSGVPVRDWGYVFYDEKDKAIFSSDPQLTRKQVCGMTITKFDDDGSSYVESITISTKEPMCDIDQNITHELGHLWAEPGTHAESGVGAEGSSKKRTSLINEDTLNWVCSHTNCVWFMPETI